MESGGSNAVMCNVCGVEPVERRGPQAMVKTRNRFALEIHYGCDYHHCNYCYHYNAFANEISFLFFPPK